MNLSLSLVYFTVLSARTIQHEMTDELERIWKEEAIAKLRYYPSICLKELIKTMKKLNIAEIQAENQSRHLLSTSLKCYHLHLPAVSFHITLEDIIPR